MLSEWPIQAQNYAPPLPKKFNFRHIPFTVIEWTMSSAQAAGGTAGKYTKSIRNEIHNARKGFKNICEYRKWEGPHYSCIISILHLHFAAIQFSWLTVCKPCLTAILYGTQIRKTPEE